jgi:hypothetical protein
MRSPDPTAWVEKPFTKLLPQDFYGFQRQAPSTSKVVIAKMILHHGIGMIQQVGHGHHLIASFP